MTLFDLVIGDLSGLLVGIGTVALALIALLTFVPRQPLLRPTISAKWVVVEDKARIVIVTLGLENESRHRRGWIFSEAHRDWKELDDFLNPRNFRLAKALEDLSTERDPIIQERLREEIELIRSQIKDPEKRLTKIVRKRHSAQLEEVFPFENELPTFQCIMYRPYSKNWTRPAWYGSEWVQLNERDPKRDAHEFPEHIFARKLWPEHPVKVFRTTLWIEPGEKILVERVYNCPADVAALKLALQVKVVLGFPQTWFIPLRKIPFLKWLTPLRKLENSWTTTLTIIVPIPNSQRV